MVTSQQRHVLLVPCVWQRKKKMGNMLHYWSRLVQTLDQLIAPLIANARRGSNGSEPVCFDPFCARIGWCSFDRWTRMKVGHVLRKCVLFKPNHCNWSSYLQLYFKIIFMYNFCNRKVSWTMNCRFVRMLKKLVGCTHLFKNIYKRIAWYTKGKIFVIVYVHGHMSITVLLVHLANKSTFACSAMTRIIHSSGVSTINNRSAYILNLWFYTPNNKNKYSIRRWDDSIAFRTCFVF